MALPRHGPTTRRVAFRLSRSPSQVASKTHFSLHFGPKMESRTDRKRLMTDGRWPMTDGRWPMTDGRWPMTDGRWPSLHPRRRFPWTTGERFSIVPVDGSRVEKRGASRFVSMGARREPRTPGNIVTQRFVNLCKIPSEPATKIVPGLPVSSRNRLTPGSAAASAVRISSPGPACARSRLVRVEVSPK